MIEVGARLGYTQASVERVIEGTGIARSTFYEHFADREECFLAALDLLAERLLAEVRGMAQSAGNGETAGSVVGAMVAYAEKEPAGAALLFVESLAGGRASLELREGLLKDVETILEKAWATVPAGAAAPDLPAAALIGGLFRLLAMRLRQGEVGLGGLAEDLRAWVGSYAIASGHPRWREPARLGSVRVPAPESLPSLAAPHPLSGGRHRLSAAEVARSQQLRILSATAKCSYEQGYAAVTVADITSAAQVSRKAFYARFRDKGHAATAANERAFQAAVSACAAAFFAAASWPERVWAGGATLLGFLAIHPEDAYLGFVEPHAIGEAAVQNAYDRLEAFTLFLEEGYHYRPEAEELPKASSEALTAVMFELAFRELRERRSVDGLLQILPQLAYMILAPFMGPEAAGEFVEAKMAETAT